jgi:hypothetical protein
VIGIAPRDIGGMSLVEFSDAVGAFNAAQGGEITDREEDELAQMIGLD